MKPEKAKLVIDGMKEAGINFSVGVPDRLGRICNRGRKNEGSIIV